MKDSNQGFQYDTRVYTINMPWALNGPACWVRHDKALTPSELGCTLSHLEALKDFLNSSEQYAVVFELIENHRDTRLNSAPEFRVNIY